MRSIVLFTGWASFVVEMVMIGVFWIVVMFAMIARTPLGGAILLTLLVLLWWR